MLLRQRRLPPVTDCHDRGLLLRSALCRSTDFCGAIIRDLLLSAPHAKGNGRQGLACSSRFLVNCTLAVHDWADDLHSLELAEYLWSLDWDYQASLGVWTLHLDSLHSNQLDQKA